MRVGNAAATPVELTPHMRRNLLLAFALNFLLVRPAAPEEVSPVTTTTPALPAVDEWRAMNFVQRHEHMTFAVHPTLMETWQTHYHTAAPKLQCVSCHGEHAEQHRYQMVYTPLKDLKPARVQALYRSDAQVSEEQRFKRDVVTPLMADLLGVPRYDPATGLGFSCFGCHPREAE